MSTYQDIKEECYEANLLLPECKLIDLTFGNVSVADPQRAFADFDYFIMKNVGAGSTLAAAPTG